MTLSATNSAGTGNATLTLTITAGGIGPLVSHTIQISTDADDGYYNERRRHRVAQYSSDRWRR